MLQGAGFTDAALLLRNGKVDPDTAIEDITALMATAEALPWENGPPICKATQKLVADATRGWHRTTHWLHHAEVRTVVFAVLVVVGRLDQKDAAWHAADTLGGCPGSGEEAAHGATALLPVLPIDLWFYAMRFIKRSWWATTQEDRRRVRAGSVITNWVFAAAAAAAAGGGGGGGGGGGRYVVASEDYRLSYGGAVATKSKDMTDTGVIAGGAGCAPMTAGVHYWELEVVRNEDYGGGKWPGLWYFGVCRPEIDPNDRKHFANRDDTWLMYQHNKPGWKLYCKTCKGTGMTWDPAPQIPQGSRIGLLLDLDNCGTLTMYSDNKPCGTIAEGLTGSLLPCISSYWNGKAIKIHGGLAPPQ